MHVVGHQAVREHARTGIATCAANEPQIALAVPVAEKHALAPVAALRYMMRIGR
jgi:hypothetical protein